MFIKFANDSNKIVPKFQRKREIGIEEVNF